jgi:AbrB family looped-hinge helix DNA binding protein
MKNETIVYNAEDIFKDIEGDDQNVLMNIPPEIAEKMGWKPGDLLKIEVLAEGGLSISRVENE